MAGRGLQSRAARIVGRWVISAARERGGMMTAVGEVSGGTVGMGMQTRIRAEVALATHNRGFFLDARRYPASCCSGWDTSSNSRPTRTPSSGTASCRSPRLATPTPRPSAAPPATDRGRPAAHPTMTSTMTRRHAYHHNGDSRAGQPMRTHRVGSSTATKGSPWPPRPVAAQLAPPRRPRMRVRATRRHAPSVTPTWDHRPRDHR